MLVKIQQLVYDGTKLFCPDHPNGQLEETVEPNFRAVCIVPTPRPNLGELGKSQVCMNSAEWATRSEMLRELAALRK